MKVVNLKTLNSASITIVACLNQMDASTVKII